MLRSPLCAPQVSFGAVGPHLEPVPDLPEGELDPFRDDFDESYETPERPPWWRLVAILVVVAMVVATPFAYALYTVFH